VCLSPEGVLKSRSELLSSLIALQPLPCSWAAYSALLILYTVGRIYVPWDQPIVRRVPTHGNT
jgi:hypothetical protein